MDFYCFPLDLYWFLSISYGFLLISYGNLLISYGNLFISCRAHARSRGDTFSYFFIPFHVFFCSCFSYFFICFHTFSYFSYFSLTCSPTFSYFFTFFSNSFLLFPRSFPGLGFSNSNVLFLYYFIVYWHRRSMGQKLGAARGAPKRHLQVISWPLAGDIVRGGRPLKSTKNNGKINQNQQIAPLTRIVWGIPWSGNSMITSLLMAFRGLLEAP